MRHAAAQLQVVGHVAERRVAAQLFGQELRPGVEQRAVIAFEHVLILAAARAGTQVDVLPGAQVQNNARHLGQLGTQAVDELADRHITFGLRLERDPEAAVGDGLVAARHPHRMRERQHRRVRADDFRQLQVFFNHVRVGNIGSGFGSPQRKSGVLNRKEALGYEDVADHRQHQGQTEHAEHQPLMGQRLAQASLVGGQ